MSLNPQQQDIKDNASGKCLVIAGAGTGKTLTLTTLVDRIAKSGVRPDQILITTFTNAAAAELREKIVKNTCISKRVAANMWIGTFHGLSYRYLSKVRKRKFSMASDAVLRAMLDRALYKMRELKNIDDEYSDDDYKLCIDYKETFMTSWKETKKHFESDTKFISHVKIVHELIKEDKRKNKLYGFVDLISKFSYCVKTTDFKHKFKWILVDESQDSNRRNHKLIERFEAPNVIYVGDSKQSLYAFRGAAPELFSQKIDTHKVFNLQYNYRSSSDIIDFANSFVSSHPEFSNQTLIPIKSKDRLPQYYLEHDSEEIENRIYNRVLSLIKNYKANPSSIAILSFSTRGKMFQNLAYRFRQTKIPYDLKSNDKINSEYIQAFFNCVSVNLFRKELNTVMALTLIPGVGPAKADIAFSNIQTNKPIDSNIVPFLKILEKRKPHKVLDACRQFIFNSKIKNLTEDDAIFLDKLIADMLKYPTLLDALNGYMLDRDREDDMDKVAISTIHTAKGLEWEHVIVANIGENKTPAFIGDKGYPFEDNKNFSAFCLYYTAFTRAKSTLALYGKLCGDSNSAAPFMHFIPLDKYRLFIEGEEIRKRTGVEGKDLSALIDLSKCPYDPDIVEEDW